MNKRNIIISFALAAIAFTGCKHDLEHNMVPDKLGFSYSSSLQQPSVFNNEMDVAIIKSGKGSSSATVRIERLTQEELTKWCQNNGAAEYKLAEELKYEVSEEEFNFAASDIRKTFKVKWQTDFFANSANNGTDYVIGFKLVDASLELGKNRDTLIIQPCVSRVSFADKTLKTTFPSTKDFGAESNKYEGEINLDRAVPSTDVVVELGTDDSFIEEEAKLREKDFKPAPAGLFSFENATVTIKAGETIAHFDFKLDYSVLFDTKGNFKETNVNYMIPVVFKKKTPALLGNGKVPVGFVIVTVSEDDTVEPPIGEPKILIHGPWEILEGADNHIGKDPLCPSPDWYGNYNVSKLVDWGFGFGNNDDASKNGFWGSYFWSPIEFPMVFVFDAGEIYTFDRFYKVDSDTFQGQFRDFEVYVAKEYAGADTKWKLACKGKTGDKGWQRYADTKIDGVVNVDKVLEMFSYAIPEKPEAEGSEVNYTRGRYIKLCITASSKVSSKDCGYLMEFYADGWKM